MNFLRPRQLALIAAATSLFGITAVTVPVMAATDIERGAGGFEVNGADTLTVAGFVPGDRSDRQIVEIRADASVNYEIHVEWTGSAALAAQLEVTLTDAAGQVVFSGPLGDLEVAGDGSTAASGILGAGAADAIGVEVLLPLTAGNEVQGQALTLQVVVQAVGTAA